MAYQPSARAASYVVVVDQNGERGVIEASQLDGANSQAVVWLAGGEQVVVPVDTLVLRQTGGYYLPLSLSTLQRGTYSTQSADAHSDALVLPVIMEEIEIHKDWVERGRIRITKTVQENEHVVRELLTQEQVDVQRVPVNQTVVEQPPAARYEGDTLIIPLVEEVLVVEKRLVLKEELHITKRRVQTEMTQPVTLRSQDVIVERVTPDSDPQAGSRSSST